jgi:hypothetical protein
MSVLWTEDDRRSSRRNPVMVLPWRFGTAMRTCLLRCSQRGLDARPDHRIKAAPSHRLPNGVPSHIDTFDEEERCSISTAS